MSRPPLPIQAQVPTGTSINVATGLETAHTEAQAIPTVPKQRNMTRPSFLRQEQALAGLSTETVITVPHGAQTSAPPKQRNMSRPLLPTHAPAPTMSQSAGVPIHLPIEALLPKLQNMSRPPPMLNHLPVEASLPKPWNMSQPPHPDVPAKEGATDAMAGSSFKQWNMT